MAQITTNQITMKTAEEIRSEQIEKFKDRLRKHLLQPTSLQPYPSAAWMTITVSEAALILSELETTPTGHVPDNSDCNEPIK